MKLTVKYIELKPQYAKYGLLLVLLLEAAFGTAQPSYSYDVLQKGEHAVGYVKWRLVDDTRPSIDAQKQGRELDIFVWYPAVEDSGQSIYFTNYLMDETESGRLEDSDFFEWPLSNGSDKKNIDAFLARALPMWGRFNAELAKGKFPVALLFHGYPASFCFMAEYFSSHGIITVVVPTKGYDEREMEVDQIGMETQVRDYEFALSMVRQKFADAIVPELSVVGFSFGGQSAVAFSLRNQVSKIVSLDGGIGSRFGFGLLEESPFYDLERIDAPLLHIYNPEDRYTYLTGIKTLIQSDRDMVSMDNVEHWTFTSFGKLNVLIENLFSPYVDTSTSFETILWSSLNFIKPVGATVPKELGSEIKEIVRLHAM